MKINIELIKKGIFDAEISIENRKNEIYYSTSYLTSNNDFDYSNTFQNSFQYQDPEIYSYLMKDDFKQNNELILLFHTIHQKAGIKKKILYIDQTL